MFIPDVTLPYTEYCPLRLLAAATQIKNCEVALLMLLDRAAERIPLSCLATENSALTVGCHGWPNPHVLTGPFFEFGSPP
jgi:hypothetical protein